MNKVTESHVSFVRRKTYEAKKAVLDMVVAAGTGHLSSAYSCAEILSVLYYQVMRVDSKRPGWGERDRFIMSKNHASVMQYPILSDLGFFGKERLSTFLSADGSVFAAHSSLSIPGVDFAGGSLGIGLGVAAGLAYAAKYQGNEAFTFCLVGDGECYEGSIWESAIFAAHYKLNNLIAFIDRNKLAIVDYTEGMIALDPLNDKWQSFGWEVRSCNGHDIEALLNCLQDIRERESDKPLVIIADTIKGKGISFIENQLNWHGAVPKQNDIARAYADLQKELVQYGLG
jgi:transketolase